MYVSFYQMHHRQIGESERKMVVFGHLLYSISIMILLCVMKMSIIYE